MAPAFFGRLTESIAVVVMRGVGLIAWAKSHRETLAAGAGLVILCLAIFALSDILREIRGDDVRRAIRAIQPQGWIMAIGCTALSFACLTLYDFVALRVIGSQIRFPIAARAAASSYAISNTLGLSVLTGGSVRMRIYSRAGLDEGDIARVIVLVAATFWAGIFALFGLALVFEPAGIRLGGFLLPEALKWGVPIAVVGLFGAYLVWTAREPRSARLFGASLPVPRPRFALAQLVVAAVDLAASAAVIFVLIPDSALDLYPQFLVAYIIALGVAVLTHSPGGLGVFEAMVFLLLPQIDKSNLAAALIGYRVVYYLIPFALALVALAISEGEALRRRAAPVARMGQLMAVSLAPVAMAGLVFSAGAILILTGALPAVPGRVETVLAVLPPVVVDISHFAASLLGTVMMFVAYGLYRRLDIAWIAGIGLLVLGTLSAVFRGLDFEESAFLAIVACLLVWTRPAFYRQSALTGERPNAGWLLAIATVLAASAFFGLFTYKDIAYRHELWWQVQPQGDAVRFMRASFGVLILAFVLALRRLGRPRREAEIRVLEPATWTIALEHAQRTEAHLARTGDKSFLVAETGDAFLMYRVRGFSYIAMGDPVGTRERWSELAWRFRELADRQGGRIAFYECGAEFLPFAVDLGLSIMKLGEEALVPLLDFSLDGKSRANLRHAVNRMEREDATFRIVEGDDLAALLPELELISREWLGEKKQREKQFSLGRFDAVYLLGAPVAVVEQSGKVLAFANLWPLPSKQEISFDLMRQRADAPPGTMDFLLAQLMLWAKDQGFASLSLGVAPLSGIESRRLAPLWARLAGMVFRHGERLYGYVGLRQYKEKFRPEWRSRYFAAPRGLSMAAALVDVTLLVSAPAVSPRARASATSRASPAAVPESSRAAPPSGDQVSAALPESRIPSAS